jgi:AcrR family transcriptional regulator
MRGRVATAPIDRLAARAGTLRPPGARALRTRARLLETTNELIHEVPYRELTSALVTQRLGLSPSAFYRYFAEINDAVLELTAGMGVAVDAITEIVATGDWEGDGAQRTALAVIDAMARFWVEYRVLYRVTDLCADEGDDRFAEVKAATFAGLTAAIEQVVAGLKREGRHPTDLDPFATACIVVTMLIHTMARESGFGSAGVSPRSLRTHLARVLVTIVTRSAVGPT